MVEANRAAGRRVAVAESCTGGLVCAALTEIPGSSDVFEAGYVTYSNASKIAELKVSEEVVDTFGAVSIATAWAMAQRRARGVGRRCRGGDHRDRRARRRHAQPSRSGRWSSPAPSARPARTTIVADQKLFDEPGRAPACGFRRRFARSTC